jgi:sugar O-acyltransferase (sialic acid O-acetyltransferase NeuD family)
MLKIILIGAGPHSEVVIDIIEEEEKYQIVGLIDSNREIGSKLKGYSILGRQEDIQKITFENKVNSGLVCIGDNWSRMKVVNQIVSLVPSFNFITTIHPKTNISKNAKIGKGVVIMPGVTINTDAIVGNFCIINTNSSFEHYCIMDDFSSISAGVTTGGFVKIGQFSAIALGATIFDRIEIGYNSVIGSASLVSKNVPNNVLVYGIPAKIIKERKAGEKFLK